MPEKCPRPSPKWQFVFFSIFASYKGDSRFASLLLRPNGKRQEEEEGPSPLPGLNFAVDVILPPLSFPFLPAADSHYVFMKARKKKGGEGAAVAETSGFFLPASADGEGTSLPPYIKSSSK